MSDFMPIDSMPYWTGPRRPSIHEAPAEDAPKGDGHDGDHKRAQHMNESLAKFLHAFHLHYYGEPRHKDVQPRVDVVESKTAFTAYVELPGMSREEVYVEANDHLYHVSFSGVLKERVADGAAGEIIVGHKGAPTRDEESQKPAPEASQEAGAAEGAKESHSELRWCISERKTGHFHRVLQLPVGFVDMGAVKARMANGLMVITVPKREPIGHDKAKPGRKVEVAPVSPVEEAPTGQTSS